MTNLIENAGHNVVSTYENGPHFLNAMTDMEVPDVVFCDIILPEMTGLDLLTIIHEGFPNTKIIMLSGVTHAEAISAALRLGAIDFLQKPVDKDRIILLLNKLSQVAEPPGVEQISTIGVACKILTGFLEELTAHASSTLRKVLEQQMQSILMDVESKTEGMLSIDAENAIVELDPNLWGIYSEEEVLETIREIPQDIQYELGFLYSDDLIQNLYDQAMLTLASKKRFVQFFDKIKPDLVGLPILPQLAELGTTKVSKAGTTYEELDKSISIALFVFDYTGPEIVSRLNPDLLSEADLMKNSIFYYTLVDEENFQEGLFGPLPVTSEFSNSLSSLAYTMKKTSESDNQERVVILTIYYAPAADRIVADYNKISFIIRTRLVPLNYINEIDKTVIRGLLDDIIDYLMES